MMSVWMQRAFRLCNLDHSRDLCLNYVNQQEFKHFKLENDQYVQD